MASTVRVIPWRDDFREFFDLSGADWAAPAVMRSTVNAARSRMTVEAVFRKPDGHPVKLISKLTKDAEGTWWGVEERLEAKFVWTPEAVTHEP